MFCGTMSREQTEDLKAFEQRLIECVDHMRYKALKWRIMIVAVCVWMMVSLWQWWRDDTNYDSYWEMFAAHKWLSVCVATLFLLYVCGVFERNSAPKVCRSVLHDYNMSCDERGKLILKRSKPVYS